MLFCNSNRQAAKVRNMRVYKTPRGKLKIACSLPFAIVAYLAFEQRTSHCKPLVIGNAGQVQVRNAVTIRYTYAKQDLGVFLWYSSSNFSQHEPHTNVHYVASSLRSLHLHLLAQHKILQH